MSFDPNLVFDVGLHMGEDTEFYLKKGFRVIAFEANPELVQHCKNRFSHQIAQEQLHIIEGAIAPEDYGEYITFYSSSNSIWGTIEPDWEERNTKLGASSNKIDVKRVDILETFHSYGVPFYLKIDVEGVDSHVVEQLAKLPSVPQYISVESEKQEFKKLTRDMSALRSLGYKKFKVVQQENIPGSKLISKDLDGKTFSHVFAVHASGSFGDEISQPWLTYEQMLARYRKVFLFYRLFGDDSILQRLKLARIIRRLGRRAGISLPGW
jgi:FkbM family methyltransferase